MDRPAVAPYQPTLGRWGHTWRFLVMLATSAIAASGVAFAQIWRQTSWLLAVDIAVGVLCFVLVHFRRRWPLAIAVLTGALGMVSSTAAGPSALAAVSLATRRVWAEVIGIGLLGLSAGLVFSTLFPASSNQPSSPWWVELGSGAVVTSALLGWGMYIGSRRELVWTLQQRAERAEAEQELRATLARDSERTRIAREMHDVLGHRISQISMHAGALAYRTDLAEAALRDGITEIGTKAHEALTDLRSVLGVLRDHETGDMLDRPQPTHDEIAELVDDAANAGMRISLTDSIEPRPVSGALGRTIYRIVQEGITNAGKHAPGATLSIDLRGSPAEGVEFELRNPHGFGSVQTRPGGHGGGFGLVGLAERALLIGGRLEHRRTVDTFIVSGWLPWHSKRPG
ncbi:MAG: sensor histidine kinase [Nocardioides sp.]